ncbi:hypothetical protein B0O80DRAFT_133318 [Mortierella sp. GBAus27b]|nr:hypothetical protein B0O80DRAFT_133318 [Mortierella sp. GBAus27b]
MDGAAFQGMRFPLTAAEEALLPRPHASASQVATALPATYSRHHQHRPQYSHKHLPSTNHPYQSTAASPSRFFSFSSSSVLATRSQRPSSPPLSPSASPNPQTTFDPDDVEYPQNPKHSYQYPHQSPVSPTSYYSPPRRSFSQSPRPAGLSSPNLYSEGYESIQTHEGHQDPWIGSTRIESPVPLSDSEESSRSGTKKELPEADRQPPRRSGSKGFLGRFRESISSPNIVQHAQPSNVTTASGGPGDTEDDDSISLPQYQQRTSLESDVAPRKISFESHAELSKMSRTSPQEISDDELHSSQGQQEHASATHSKRRPSWRPSLSLIRQEGSSFNVLTPLQDQRRYPQNDRRRLTDAHAPDHDHDERHAGRKGNPGHRGKKRRRGSPRHGQTSDLEAQFQPPKANSRVLPSLADVLEKRTRYPLSYEDFEAFLRHYRAVEYLNFWAVSKHVIHSNALTTCVVD